MNRPLLLRLGIPAGVLLLVLLIFLLLGSSTTLQVQPVPKAVGTQTPIRVHLENPHGVRRLTAALEQGGARYTVFEQTQPAHRLSFLGRNEPPRDVTMQVGKSKAPALKEGPARLVIEAQSNDLRGSTDRLAYDVVVNTQPPTLTVDGFEHLINQGGSELVTFQVGGDWAEAGVRVGPYTFRSFPMPGQPENAGARFSLFAFPWDVPATTEPVVYAKSGSGNEVTADFRAKVTPKPVRTRALALDDRFLQKVDNSIDPQGQGDLPTRFVRINSETRRQNNKTLADLRTQSAERVLWSGPFRQLGNSKVEAQFADARDYTYQGRKIDHQTHLGYDLSVVKNVPVAAGNDGVVLLARNLGIYGNCVVIDHGYGLQSIYGHLSQIGVQPGQKVRKGDIIGKSGDTGLAGGDHLHFSMQVDGVQVNPVEWWDAHWIHDRILSKLPAPSAQG